MKKEVLKLHFLAENWTERGKSANILKLYMKEIMTFERRKAERKDEV